MGGPDFEACGNLFKQGANSTYAQYQYHGPVSGLYAHNARPLLITVEGCKEICGTGTQYYPWKKSSATITTWVLPVLGLLLQLPFESNAFWPTLWALARWCGSPIATLSYVFWNIKVTSKSAMMIDMSVPHNVVPDQQSDFSQMRDSLYILSVMNQYCFKRGVSSDAGEKWLRVALFSNSLPLKPVRLDARTIVERRTDLARYLREERKKGVVPVFFSLGWFLFSLALSIQAAFGQLGDNQTAHTLAFGLLLAWTPVLVIATIVDRHPTGTIRVRRKLNKFLGDVRRSLLDSEFKADYIRSLGVTEADLSWTTKLDILEFFEGDDFFTRFAGQGRRRWHHGVAHSILADSESDFIAQCGRGWLEYPGARTSMELGSQKIVGLRYFDFRMVWQIASATAIVFGTAGGAFILSYFTPTVGLGCRSGGYMIFCCIALGNFLIELLIWWLFPVGAVSGPRYRSSIPSVFSDLERLLSRTNSNGWGRGWITSVRTQVRHFNDWWRQSALRDRLEIMFLRPCEAVNSIWLFYIVIAQTFGFDQNCECFCSLWSSIGGYLDFESWDFYRGQNVQYYWSFGVSLSTFTMGTAILFITIEYCTQSHLSTENYEYAGQGLKLTRNFKKNTLWLRYIPAHLIKGSKFFWQLLLGRKARKDASIRRSLEWTVETQKSIVEE